MKRPLTAKEATPPCHFVPDCSGNPAAESLRLRLIAGMTHLDTSQEDGCVQQFQSSLTMPNPRRYPADALLVLFWCADHGLGDQFQQAALTYGACMHPPDVNRFAGAGIDLELEDITRQQLDFFIATLPRCPQIKGIELPIPETPEQAGRLADALARNTGLHWLQLSAPDTTPLDSAALVRLFSHPTARAPALHEVRIHVEDEPAGDAPWMPALCDALSSHLSTGSARLSLPWSDEGAGQLRAALLASPGLGSLSVDGMSSGQLAVLLSPAAGGPRRAGSAFHAWEQPRTIAEGRPLRLSVSGLGITDPDGLKALLVRTVQKPGCMLKSLAFPDATFDAGLVEALIPALRRNTSLIELDLGNTPLGVRQRQAIDDVLRLNRNAALLAFNGFGRA